MIKNVIETMADMLADAGVKRMYGVADGSLITVADVLQRKGRIRWIPVMYEKTAALAASAEAQMTGEVASCCGSCGFEKMSLMHGLYDAWRSAVPVFALSSSEMDADGETNPQRCFSECASYCGMIGEASQIASVMGEALRSARETPGVGVAVLSHDALKHVTILPTFKKAVNKPRVAMPPASDVRELARLINGVERITFFCGSGCVGAGREIVQLAKKVCAPVVYTLRGKEVMEKDNPCAVGMTGLLGWGDAVQAVYDCDVLVMWGADFPYSSFLPHGKQVAIAQVDCDESHLGRSADVTLGVVGDVAETAMALLPLVKGGRSSEHLERSLVRHRKLCRKLFSSINYVNENNPLRPEYVTHIVSEQAEPDAVFVVDTGMPVLWAARYVSANGTRRMIGSFKQGAKACGVAMALGAQVACPERQVIALCCMGGLIAAMGDMLTLLREKLPVKLLVYDPSPLDEVRTEVRNVGYHLPFETWGEHDVASAVRAMGLYVERVEDPSQAVECVRRWLSRPGPALLDVVTDAHASALPPDMALMREYGFSDGLSQQALQGELRHAWQLLFGKACAF